MADRATDVVRFVESCSSSESLEAGDHLKAIEGLKDMQLGFQDVQVFLFKPKLNVLLNLVGLHYCIHWLKVPVSTSMSHMYHHIFLESILISTFLLIAFA